MILRDNLGGQVIGILKPVEENNLSDFRIVNVINPVTGNIQRTGK